MNDERYLRDWLRETTDSTTDPNAAADKLVAQISDTTQRRRRLPSCPGLWPAETSPKIPTGGPDS